MAGFECLVGLRPSSEGGLQLLLVQPHLAGHHFTNRLCQQCRRIVLSKNSGNPRPDQLRSHGRIHTCRDNENLSLKSLFPRQPQKLSAIAFAKIKIKKYKVNRFAAQNLQSLCNRRAVSSHLESRFRREGREMTARRFDSWATPRFPSRPFLTAPPNHLER